MRKRDWLKIGVVVCVLGTGAVRAQDVAPEEAPPEPVLQVDGATEHVTVLDLLMKGGPMMYPLIVCSVFMVAFAIERSIGLRRKKVLPPGTRACLGQAMRSPASVLEPLALMRELEGRTDPLARVAIAGLRRSGRPLQDIEKAFEDAGAKEVGRLLRNNRALSAIASITPLIGLLGTVTGIIRAFMTVAANEEALGRTELLAGGIYEALVATAAGLAVAITSLLIYLVCQEQVDKLTGELDDAVAPLVEKLAPKVREDAR